MPELVGGAYGTGFKPSSYMTTENPSGTVRLGLLQLSVIVIETVSTGVFGL